MAEVKEIAQEFGDMPPAFALLVAYVGDKTLPLSSIRKEGMYWGTNVTYSINQLESRGFLKRELSRYSLKFKMISLTPKGLSLAERIRQGLAKREMRAA